MRFIAIGAFLVGGVLWSGATLAKPTDPGKDPGQKVICRIDTTVGSHISGRICKTRAHWDEMRTDARDLVDDTFGKATGINPFATPKPSPSGN